jgi:glutathione S-transferase
MLKIWGRVNSVNVQKVMWAVAELQVPHTRVDAGMQFGVVNTPEYRRLNPNGRVPTIEDGDFVLWESNTIVRYLYAKYGPQRSHGERAASEKWMDWTLAYVHPPLTTMFWQLCRTPEDKRDMPAVDAAVKQAGEALKIADEALASGQFIAGTELTPGDIPLGCFVNRWFQLPLQRPTLNHLAGWYERLTTRPAYKQHVMLPLT